jgi:hypothetical protein
MEHHISLFKNNSENLRSMTHQLMQRHISPLKNILKNSRKMYCNSIRIINDEFSQHASIHHLSSLKNDFENSTKNIFPKLVPQL